MLTLPLVPVERSHIGEVAWTNVDRRVSFDASFGRPADAPLGAFCQAAQTHRLGPAALDALIAELPVGVLVVDGDGIVSYANAVARSLGATTMPSLQRVVARALLSEQVPAERRQPVVDATRRIGIAPRPTRVVDANRRVLFNRAVHAAGHIQVHFAHWNANVRATALDVNSG